MRLYKEDEFERSSWTYRLWYSCRSYPQRLKFHVRLILPGSVCALLVEDTLYVQAVFDELMKSRLEKDDLVESIVELR